MSEMTTFAVAPAVHRSVLAGSVIVADAGPRGQPWLILGAPDDEGYSRVAPVVTAGGPGKGLGMAIESGDFTEGGVNGWLRLDRAGWQHIGAADTLGILKPAALARVHRVLST